MTSLEKYAVEITKEIVVSRVSNDNSIVNEVGGKQAGDYFKAVYDAVLEVVGKED